MRCLACCSISKSANAGGFGAERVDALGLFDDGTPEAQGPAMPSTASAESLNRVTSLVVQAAINVHKTLGPGLLENAYLACLYFELSKEAVVVCRVGLLLNFGARTMKEGIKRVVNDAPAIPAIPALDNSPRSQPPQRVETPAPSRAT